MRIHSPSRWAVALLSLLAVGCTRRPAVELPVGEAYARGPIESLTHHATASNLLVRPGSGEACGISATVDAETRYLARTPAGEVRELQRSELALGDTVEVYVEGPLTRSCPPQGRASAVVRVSTPSEARSP